MITQERLHELFDYKDGELFWKNPKKLNKQRPDNRAGAQLPSGWTQIKIEGTFYYKHYLIWVYHHNTFPKIVTHIDMDSTNDKIENLLDADKNLSSHRHVASASRNIKKNSTNKYIGLSVNRKPFTVQIFRKVISNHADEIEAAKVYDEHAYKHFGSKAKLNFYDPKTHPGASQFEFTGKSNKTSKYRGVSKRKIYRAHAVLGGKFRSFGFFDNIEDAARAYDEGVSNYYGKHAVLNFPYK